MNNPIRRQLAFALLSPTATSPLAWPPLEHTLTLEWRPDDPWSVAATLGRVDWEFAWELLPASLEGPAGIGDVHIAPLGHGGVRHHLTVANGNTRATLQLRTAALRAFVTAVQAVWADRPLTDDDIAAFYAGQDAQ